ncbi:hypothetical protein [Listeria booriae]|uniref:hypothetical protein n=1 Tax=Listeria booriae TaxID=1552123 RepID=UPI0016267AD9|nr:hypothetical protein [Listeria booriae]MBC2189715.1 hypothetical protein [Listeria booriae]MBC2196216.1 hypothetical protein [Listeria booriae]
MTEKSILDEQFILQLKKETEKMMINLAVAASAIHKSQTNQQHVAQKSKDVIKVTQNSVEHITGSISHNLKGQFGDKVKETLAIHHKKLQQLV